MKPYSEELRERLAAAGAAGHGSLGQLAAPFSVSRSFVDKRLKRQRPGGGRAAWPHRGGPAPLLHAAARDQLAAGVAQQPAATREEWRGQWGASGGPAVRGTSVWQAVQTRELRRKKSGSTPPSATRKG